MLPQRERIVRKAKERSIDYSMANFNRTSSSSSSQTPTKRNARSYKPFTNTTNVMDAASNLDENTTMNTSSGGGNDNANANDSTYYETPPKKVKANTTTTTTTSRQQNKTTTTTTTTKNRGSSSSRTTTNRINVSTFFYFLNLSILRGACLRNWSDSKKSTSHVIFREG
jgi:hypothetical protein